MSTQSVLGSLLSFILSHLHVWLTIAISDWKQNSPGLGFAFIKHLYIETKVMFIKWKALANMSSCPWLFWGNMCVCFIIMFLLSNWSPSRLVLWHTMQYVYVKQSCVFAYTRSTCLLALIDRSNSYSQRDKSVQTLSVMVSCGDWGEVVKVYTKYLIHIRNVLWKAGVLSTVQKVKHTKHLFLKSVKGCGCCLKALWLSFLFLPVFYSSKVFVHNISWLLLFKNVWMQNEWLSKILWCIIYVYVLSRHLFSFL